MKAPDRTCSTEASHWHRAERVNVAIRRRPVKADRKKVLAVCGPTASGKSELADALAELLTQANGGRWAPTLSIDSMQVYRELPVITNQARRRPAGLVGIVSVVEEWTVARHKERVGEEMHKSGGPFVFDAGTGMYLNVVLLDVPLAPKVDEEIRKEAEEQTADAENARRESRRRELLLVGAAPRGSIWEGELRDEVVLIYLRPPKSVLDAAVAHRSEKISHEGVPEAAKLLELSQTGTTSPNPSVRDSIGVRELTGYLRGEATLEEARARINLRTRRLARRQMGWFDKLARTLEDRARVIIAGGPQDPRLLQCIHDIIGAWTEDRTGL